MTASSRQQAEVDAGRSRRRRRRGGRPRAAVRALATLLVVLVAAGGLVVGQATPAAALSNYDPAYWHDAGTNGTVRSDWMASLKDGLPLSSLTIPGTHDSGAFKGDLTPQVCNIPLNAIPCGFPIFEQVEDLAVTQSMTFYEQLVAGIRAMDVRLGQYSGGSDCSDTTKLWVLHGELVCFRRTVDDVFGPVSTFLAQHPSETVIMKVSREKGADTTFDPLLREAMSRYPGAFWRYTGNRNPTLGEMRGKIVLLQVEPSKVPACGAPGAPAWPRCDSIYGIPVKVNTATDGSYEPGALDPSWVNRDSYAWNFTTDMAEKWRAVEMAFNEASFGNITTQHSIGLNATIDESAAGYLNLALGAGFRPKSSPFFFASGKSYSGTYDSQAPTPWTPLSCGPANACLSRDPGGFYYDGGWVYYKGINHLAMEYVNNANLGRLGLVFADFPNPGRPSADYYEQQGLIGMLIKANDKINAKGTATTTTVTTPNTVPLGSDSWFLAGVNPSPGAGRGTIQVTSNGVAIPGCEAISIGDDGGVSCKFTGSALGSYSIRATYTPGATSAGALAIAFGSQSSPKTVQVTNTPAGVPLSGPSFVEGVPGNGTIKVDWAPVGSSDQGSSPISTYTATASPGGATCTAPASKTFCVLAVSDVTETYVVTVAAVNGQGTGPSSLPSQPVSFPPAVGTKADFQDPGIVGPAAITLGPDGALWFANASSVGRMTTAGIVTTFPAPITDPNDIVVGPDGALWITNGSGNSIVRVTTAGLTSTFTDATNIASPRGITAGPDGALWFTNTGNNSIGRITTGGVTTKYASGSISQPQFITAGPDGALWFTSAANNKIGRIPTDGSSFTFIASAGLVGPYDITAGADGRLWFTTLDNRVGSVTTAGSVNLLPNQGAARFIAPGPDGALWFTNGGLSTGRILPGASPTVTTSYPGPGVAVSGIAPGPDGNMWIVGGSGADSTLASVWAGRLPGAPAKPTTLRGNQKVTVSWAPPPADPVFVAAYAPTSYKVTTFQGGVAQAATCTATAPATSCEVTGLTNGTSYTFSVTATNVIGTGPASVVSDTVAPSGAPAAPPQPTVLKGNRSVTVAWDPPADPGASPVSAYAVIGYQLIPGPGQVWTPLGPLCTWTSGPRSCDVKNLSPNVQYKFVVVAQNGQGTSAPSPESEVVSPYLAPPVSLFHPLAVPTRILDSRPPPEQVGPYSTPWGPGTVRDVQVAGAGGVPANASSVTLNVTVTGTTAASFLTVWPKGADQPTASNLNWVAGQTIPNAVTVTVGAEGKVSVFNPSGNTNVIVDVVGYYDDSGSGDGFTSLVPVRVQDSRPPPEQVGPYSTPWGPGTDRSVQVAGTGGVPADADAVVANVTVTGTTAESFLTVYPEGAAKPTASSLNWRAGQTIPNAVTIKVGTGGKIRIFNNSGNANVLVDVVGYFKAGTGDSFHPTAPLRIQDSRPAPDTAGAYATPWNAGTSRTVAVPAGMKSVLANVTVTGATAESFVTTWNTGADRPTASSLNFKAGVTIANSVTTKIGPDGSFSAFNNSGNVHVIVDVAGWYG